MKPVVMPAMRMETAVMIVMLYMADSEWCACCHAVLG